MNTDQKVEVIVNLLPLLPAVIKGVQEAIDVYDKMIAALKNGITPEEMDAALTKRDAVLQRVIDKTENA